MLRRGLAVPVAIVLVALAAAQARAQSEFRFGEGTTSLRQGAGPASPAATPSPLPPPQPTPVPPAGAPAGPSVLTAPAAAEFLAGEGAALPFVPFMLGDYAGFVASGFSDLKIAEGESPRPMDRVFYKFNFYDNLNKAQFADPSQPIHSVELYRQVIGLEKTVFDSRFSLGLRLPFNTLQADAKEFVVTPTLLGDRIGPGGPGFSSTQFGNVSAIAKAVLWEDHASGSLISGGATISFPTATSRLLAPGVSTVTYLQPYAGFLLQNGNAFVQGFASILLPIVRTEATMLFLDAGAGYVLYRNASARGWLTAVAPTVELHLADPLRQADGAVRTFGTFDTLQLHNDLNLTLGATFELCHRTTLGLGLVIPLTGPKPFDLEALAQLNYRF
jgi:hypothetical protein